MTVPDAAADDFSVEVSGLPPHPPAAAPGPAESAPPDAIEPPPESIETEPPPADGEPEPEAAAPPSPARNADGTFARNNGKKVKPAEARIHALTREREEARRGLAQMQEHNALLRQALEDAQRRGTPPPQPQEPRPSAWERLKTLPGAPRSSDFADYDDFILAATDFVARHRNAELVQGLQHGQQAAHAATVEQARFDGYGERMAQAVQADPHLFDRLSPEVLALRPFSQLRPGERPSALNAIAEEILDSPHAAAMMQYLSDTPDELRRLATLHPRHLLREMARLEHRFDAAAGPGSARTTPISQARPPIQPVSGAPPSVEAVPDDDEPLDRFVARENALERKRRGFRT